jgi:hypothetical protein
MDARNRSLRVVEMSIILRALAVMFRDLHVIMQVGLAVKGPLPKYEELTELMKIYEANVFHDVYTPAYLRKMREMERSRFKEAQDQTEKDIRAMRKLETFTEK